MKWKIWHGVCTTYCHETNVENTSGGHERFNGEFFDIHHHTTAFR